MAEHFPIPQNTQLGLDVRSLVLSLRAVREQAVNIGADIETRLVGGNDYTLIEQDLGLQAGQGADLYSLIVGTKNTLIGAEGTDADKAYAVGKMGELMRRCGK